MASSASESPVFYLPDLGEGLEEAELIEWSVDVGQKVEENDILAKMETAKALVEVPSPRGGIIATLHGKPGQVIKVGSPLVTFQASKGKKKSSRAAKPQAAEAKAETRSDAGSVVGNLSVAEEAGDHKVLAAPAVRKLARDKGVELESIQGTGIGGRITAHDVEAAAGQGTAPVRPARVERGTDTPSPAAPPARPETTPMTGDRIPFRGVRKTIADHLRYSVSHAVHYTVMDEADVTALDALRRKLIAASNEKISLLPFVAVAVCRVLSGDKGKHFIRLNSSVDDHKQEIVQHHTIHLGIATDTESGLMVPVIRNAEHMGVLELSRHIGQLAQSARDRTLTPEQLTGSTFTISNFGAMGGRFGTPIINYPEAGILAVGRAREGVVVRDGLLGVGKLLPLSLSADHRVIDGATAATALAKIVELLQTPDQIFSPWEK